MSKQPVSPRNGNGTHPAAYPTVPPSAISDEDQRLREMLADSAQELSVQDLLTRNDELLGIMRARIEDRDEREAIQQQPIHYQLPDGWPAALNATAFRGVVGDIVQAIEPHTEADSAAVLFQLLTGVGNVIGRNPYVQIEGDKHYPNLFVVIVGRTGKGRKGTGWSRARSVLESVASDWAASRIQSGLSSGEGLIETVRDDLEKRTAVYDDRGNVIGRRSEIADCGVDDKRVLFQEPEFGGVLKVAARDGNNLSPTIRQAWDSGNLRVITKQKPTKATGAHVSIIGHITPEELSRYLEKTDVLNGFGNRFLWICSRRSKRLPEGGGPVDLTKLVVRLSRSIEIARTYQEIPLDKDARKLWVDRYEELTAGKPGDIGALTDRAEAQVIRMALLYALLDRSATIGAPHLMAALELWRYAAESVQYLFGPDTGNRLADWLLDLLIKNPTGVTRTQINKKGGGHKSEHRLKSALLLLQEYGLAQAMLVPTDGRPAETWFFTGSLPGENAK